MDGLGWAGVILVIIGIIIFAVALSIYANSTTLTGNLNWWAITISIALMGVGVILLYWSDPE